MANNHTGISISNPVFPIFQGSNYDVWSVKMKTLFLSQELWDLVENGYREEGVAVYVLRDLWKKDAKALFFIQQAMDETIFPRIAAATKSKEAWDALHKGYQGTAKVVTVKLQTLRRKFESSFMKYEDALPDYVSNLLDVVNQIRKFGEDLSERKVVEKILRSLPKKYEHIVAAIEESKNLDVFTIDELLGSLYSHEDRMKRYDNVCVENAFYSKAQPSQGGRSSNDSNNRSHSNKFRGRHSSRGRRGGGRTNGGRSTIITKMLETRRGVEMEIKSNVTTATNMPT